MASDFIELLRDIRGTQLTTQLASEDRTCIYGDITYMYEGLADIITNSQAFLDLNNISNEIVSLEAIKDDIITVEGISSEIVDVSSEPLRGAILQAQTDTVAINKVKDDTLAINDLSSDPMRSAILDISLDPVRQSVLDAGTNATTATIQATEAQLRAWESEAERMTANSNATESEDVFVKLYSSNEDGTFSFVDSTEYSSFHWKQKSSLSASGTAEDISYNNQLTDITATNMQELADNVIPKIGSVMKDMIGFVDRDTSTISFDDNTRTLTLTLDSETPMYQNGTLIKLSGVYSIVISDVDGGRYIKYDLGTDSLVELVVESHPDFSSDLLVSYIYWNKTTAKAIIVGDERHSASADTQWHKSQHIDVGALWRSGGALSYTIDDDTDVSLGVATPLTVVDEDLDHVIIHSATPTNPYEQVLDTAEIETLYVDSNGSYTTSTAGVLPFLHGASRSYYNEISGGLGSLTEVVSGKFIVYWMLGSNDSRSPIKMLMGSNVYDTLETAEVEAFEDYGLPMQEIVPLYKLVLNIDDANVGNLAKVKISKVEKITTRQSSLAQTFTATSHNGLTDRNLADQHIISSITGLETSLSEKALQTDVDNKLMQIALSTNTNPDSITTTITPDYFDVTTTTADYIIGDYVADTSTGLMYECILGSTTGTLLTNATYFTKVTVNDLVLTNSYFNYTAGITEKGYTLTSRDVTKTIDTSAVSDGLKWVSENRDGTNSFYDVKPSYEWSEIGVALNKNGNWYNNNILMNPKPSFIQNPVYIDNGIPLYIDYSQSLEVNYMDSTHTKSLTIEKDFELLDRPHFEGHGLSGHITTPDTILDFTAFEDTHNAYNAGIYTIPKDGYYTVAYNTEHNHNNSVVESVLQYIKINNSTHLSILTASSISYGIYQQVNRTFKRYFNKGDTIHCASALASADSFIHFIDKSYSNLNITYEGK